MDLVVFVFLSDGKIKKIERFSPEGSAWEILLFNLFNNAVKTKYEKCLLLQKTPSSLVDVCTFISEITRITYLG